MNRESDCVCADCRLRTSRPVEFKNRWICEDCQHAATHCACGEDLLTDGTCPECSSVEIAPLPWESLWTPENALEPVFEDVIADDDALIALQCEDVLAQMMGDDSVEFVVAA